MTKHKLSKSRPVRVYLDSSDFSDLSSPSAPSQTKDIWKSLLAFKKSGRVHFFFSDAHVFEMVPLSPEHLGSGQERANALVALCGSHALVPWSHLIRDELRRVVELCAEPVDVVSPKGDWLRPERSIMQTNWSRYFTNVERNFQAMGLNAEEIAARMELLVKNGKLTPIGRSAVVEGLAPYDFQSLAPKHPLRDADMRVLHKYWLGTATIGEVEAATRNSLRDPVWMLTWFALHGKDTEEAMALRSGGRNLHQAFSRYRKSIADLREAKGNAAAEAEIETSKCGEFHASYLEGLGNRLIELFELEQNPTREAMEFDKFAPGLSVSTRVSNDAARKSALERPRKPKVSDFSDFTHCIFAPYVDVFRTDGFVAPLLQPCVERYGVTVVSKLSDLAAAIEQRIHIRH